MTRRARLPSRIGAVFCATLLTACTANQPHPTATPTAPVVRGGTVQVADGEPAYQGFDPQAAYTPPQFELLRCCLVRTLMTYPGLPNFEGTQPVPDLATDHPSVSSDGTTWTFHLRAGIHYAPPMEEVEVSSGDIVRALLRAGSEDVNGGPGAQYLAGIEGFGDYARGEAETIAGLSTPDQYTLQVRLARPDRSIEHVFAMPFTAPIPPTPAHPQAKFGVATGHPFASTFEGGPPQADGYGPFLVATGPYMIEGAGQVDHSLPPAQQKPASGFTPGWWFDDPGSLVLVRNPSWDSATDPNRPALPDRIEVSIAPADNPYPGLADGAVDVVIGEDPPPQVLRKFTAAPELQGRVARSGSNFSRFIAINVAQPPFDDVHVRRATALVLDRGPFLLSEHETLTSHLIPDALVGGLLSAWNGSPPLSRDGNLEAAKAEMDLSSNGSDGRCTGSACRVLVVPPGDPPPAMVESLRSGLASIGIEAKIEQDNCIDPRVHAGLCFTGWFTDFPEAGNMTVPFLRSNGGFSPTLLGASSRQLERWGYATRQVPSIDLDYQRCSAVLGVEAAMCWARLDQLLTSGIVALVPVSTSEAVRVLSGDVKEFAMDQAFGEPSLDRISVNPR
jgi:ABC-type transport system substrate-binding protein